MRVLDKRRRDRLALFYAILAFGSLLLGVTAGALSPRDALPWIYPVAGLVGYVIFAQRAMRLWRRGSTPPARSRTYRWGLTAGALMLAAPGASARQTIFNVPSADVLERGKTYLELDALCRLQEPNFAAFAGRGVYGFGAGRGRRQSRRVRQTRPIGADRPCGGQMAASEGRRPRADHRGARYLSPGLVSAWGPSTIYAAHSFKNGDSTGNASLLELGFTF